jgi:hypothetical protein
VASKTASVSVKLIAIRCMVKYLRKYQPSDLQFDFILDPLLELLDLQTEAVHLSIEAFTTLAKINEHIVANMAPLVTPKLLKLFRSYHSEGSLGNDLISLFKLWCKYD